MNTFTSGIAKTIISKDVHDTRFENFCNALIGKIEGDIVVVSTSASWDMGKDGRATNKDMTIATCCTLTDKVDDKAESDLQKIANSKSKVERIYFCTSSIISEHRCTQIEGKIINIVPNVKSVTVFGAQQLGNLSERHYDEFVQYYGVELQDALALLRGEGQNDNNSETAFRLALMALGDDNSSALREHIYCSSILDLMGDERARTKQEIARDLSSKLRLGRNLPKECIDIYIDSLINDSALENESEHRYILTDAGKKTNQENQENVLNTFLNGKDILREELERSIGEKLLNDNYETIWNVFQDKLTSNFFHRGQEFVSAISNILSDDGADGDNSKEKNSALFFVNDLSDAVAATASILERKEVLKTAVKDLFEERTGKAFKWLGDLCSRFIVVCSLGLEITSGKAISDVLSKMTLVLDTDVLLSLLSAGEPDHESVIAIHRRWKMLGGQLLVARPVLKEVAHHAYIAKLDYDSVKNWIPSAEVEHHRLIDNSFVRGFAELLRLGEAKKHQWGSYIRQYRGPTEWDGSVVEKLLIHDYEFELLPSATSDEDDLQKKVYQHLITLPAYSRRKRDSHAIVNDKARRDAELYASLVHHIKAITSKVPGSSCYLVSSSKKLADVDDKFHQVDMPKFILSIPMVLYMLSLVPGVSLGMGAMRSFLFEGRIAQFTSNIERMVLRALKNSVQYDMPFAKRTTLFRNIREKLVEDAHKSGIKIKNAHDVEKLFRESLSDKNSQRTAEIIGESLDASAVDSNIEKQLRSANKEIEKLQSEISRLRDVQKNKGK